MIPRYIKKDLLSTQNISYKKKVLYFAIKSLIMTKINYILSNNNQQRRKLNDKSFNRQPI